MAVNPRALDAAISYVIDGFEPSGPWRCLYADWSEAVFETVQVKLLVSTCDLIEISPGRLRLDRLPRTAQTSGGPFCGGSPAPRGR
jgi:hypothetical protein